jgi:hypothetical protein
LASSDDFGDDFGERSTPRQRRDSSLAFFQR